VSANTVGVQDILNTSTFTLQPGQTATLVITAQVSQLLNVYTNIAKAMLFPATVLAQDSVNANGQGPALTLDKIILNPQASYMPGDTITYQITFSNVGNGAAFSAAITDILPPSVTYVSSTVTPNPVGATFTTINGTQTTIAYSNFTINPGDTYVMIVTGTVNANLLNNNNTLNTAILTSTNHPTLVDTVAFPTSPVPQISKMQSVNGSPFTDQQVTVMLNDTITYQVIVSNVGATAAVNARVTDYLPAGLQYISSSFTLNVSLTTGPFGLGQTYVRYDGFTLQPGQQATMTIVAKVIDVTNISQYNNQAQLEFFNPYQSVNDNVIAIPALGADVVFTKSITSNQTTYQGGDNISFRVTLTNNGPAPITNVTVSDIWPSQCVNFTNATVSNNAFGQTSIVNPYAWQTATMTAGQSVNIDLVGVVSNDPNCAGTHYNTGRVVYTMNGNTITLERPVPFIIDVPNPGLCEELDTNDSTVVLIDDDNDEGEVEFTCSTVNNQVANIRIDCGNGDDYSQVGSSLTYTCEYDEDDIGDRPLVQCFVDNVTNNQCQQRLIVDEPRLADCGNGIIE